MQTIIVKPLWCLCRRLAVATAVAWHALSGGSGLVARAADFELFESRIRPLLVDRCYSCHNAEGTADGGLAVDSREGLLTGGDSGPALVPGDPAGSLLLSVLRHEVDGLKMPKDSGKLDDATLADLSTWIAAGAPDPRDAPPSKEELAKATSWETIMERRRRWWSFQPVAEASPPALANNTWSEHSIDRFIL
ncbi:MAG: c-type cytochrome domain-containing protein, partial [Planctomycetota bacterium]